MTIGSAWPLDPAEEMDVRGRCLRESRPRVVRVNDEEVRQALAEPIRAIVSSVCATLDCVPPEIAADIYDRGMVVTGGGALLRGIGERLRHETGIPVLVAEEPLTSVVLGAGRMLGDMNLLRRVCMAA
jgi:rod shape-determining protein MreB and related proteins